MHVNHACQMPLFKKMHKVLLNIINQTKLRQFCLLSVIFTNDAKIESTFFNTPQKVDTYMRKPRILSRMLHTYSYPID